MYSSYPDHWPQQTESPHLQSQIDCHKLATQPALLAQLVLVSVLKINRKLGHQVTLDLLRLRWKLPGYHPHHILEQVIILRP